MQRQPSQRVSIVDENVPLAANDGAAGLRRLHLGHVDLVLSDLHLLAGDGREVLRWLDELASGSAAVAMAVDARGSEGDFCTPSVSHRMAAKPSNIGHLAAAAHELVACRAA